MKNNELERFMKGLMRQDVSVKVVVDNARVKPCRRRQTSRYLNQAKGGRMEAEAPVGVDRRMSNKGDLDISDHTRGVTRWNCLSPGSSDLQLTTPPRRSRKLFTITLTWQEIGFSKSWRNLYGVVQCRSKYTKRRSPVLVAALI
jgi:hypothetical protein